MTTIGLCMIVRDEQHVIQRCLRSVLPLLDHWTIVDTGSEDDTRQVVLETLVGIPGSIHERPWQDFGTNRSQAMRLAAPHTDYLLVVDADDKIEYSSTLDVALFKGGLQRDVYQLEIVDHDSRYRRFQLFRSSRNWRYEGVVHEYPICDGSFSSGVMQELVYHRVGGGGRSAKGAKFERDIVVLEAELVKDPDNPRCTFYLAQSYRDAGQLEKAIEVYRRRARLDGFDEERWFSLYQIAELARRTGADEEFVVGAYLRAYDERPTRAEPLVRLAVYLREKKRWHSAFLFAKEAVSIPRPSDQLFLSDAVYRWQALDEFAVSAYWVGEYAESAQACRELLDSEDLPSDAYQRVASNLQFAIGKLTAGVRFVSTEEENCLIPATLSAFAVLGPWRGGTSLVTGILQALGVDVGGPFFLANTGYPTFEDVALRNACLKCFAEDETNWGILGSRLERVATLRSWLTARCSLHDCDMSLRIGGKHPVMCALVDEIVEAWSSSDSSPVNFISVQRSAADIEASWKRSEREGGPPWWPRNDRIEAISELIQRRDESLAHHPHVTLDFTELRRNPSAVVYDLINAFDLPQDHAERAISLVK